MTSPLSEDESSHSLENETEIPDFIEESTPIEGDPEDPGKKETFGPIPDNAEVDKWIGRGLKHPPVQDDGHW